MNEQEKEKEALQELETAGVCLARVYVKLPDKHRIVKELRQLMIKLAELQIVLEDSLTPESSTATTPEGT